MKQRAFWPGAPSSWEASCIVDYDNFWEDPGIFRPYGGEFNGEPWRGRRRGAPARGTWLRGAVGAG